MKTPSFRITINSAHVATVGLASHGVCSCIIDWTDRPDVPERKKAKVRMALGGLDHAAKEFLDWPSRELSIGDCVGIEIVDYTESSALPERRLVTTENDIERKKAYVRQLAQELGWAINEDPGRTAEPSAGPNDRERGQTS